jgi:hypothetical protein
LNRPVSGHDRVDVQGRPLRFLAPATRLDRPTHTARIRLHRIAFLVCRSAMRMRGILRCWCVSSSRPPLTSRCGPIALGSLGIALLRSIERTEDGSVQNRRSHILSTARRVAAKWTAHPPAADPRLTHVAWVRRIDPISPTPHRDADPMSDQPSAIGMKNATPPAAAAAAQDSTPRGASKSRTTQPLVAPSQAPQRRVALKGEDAWKRMNFLYQSVEAQRNAPPRATGRAHRSISAIVLSSRDPAVENAAGDLMGSRSSPHPVPHV